MRTEADLGAWEDTTRPANERAALLLDAVGRGGRARLKRLGDWVDRTDEALRRALVEEGRSRGAILPDEAVGWPGKRLLRVARGRESVARVRQNPIVRDEGFLCAHCGLQVEPHGRTARDHCPRCLRSQHVDEVPGDRAADCGQLMDPVSVDIRGSVTVLGYRCRGCGLERVNRAALDGSVPDDWAAIIALSSRT